MARSATLLAMLVHGHLMGKGCLMVVCTLPATRDPPVQLRIGGQAERADLVGRVPIGSHAIRPHHHSIHPASCHEGRGGRVCDQGGRDPVMHQLEGREARPCGQGQPCQAEEGRLRGQTLWSASVGTPIWRHASMLPVIDREPEPPCRAEVRCQAP